MKKKAVNKPDDAKELYTALQELEKTKGIPMDYMLDQIKRSICIACKNNYGGNDDVVFNIDPEQGIFKVYLQKTVVEEVTDPNREVDTKLGRELDIYAVLGSKVRIALDTKNLGRIAVQTARSVIRQGIRDGERGMMLAEFRSKVQELVTAVVESIDPRSGAATIKIGRSVAVLPKSEQVGLDDIKEGSHVRVYILDVKESEKGPRAVISRTHADFVKRLFESEVPEIFDGIVEIKSVAREAGSRTKIAVFSKDAEVDAVGACIGSRGVRVANIVSELGGEKIDIVEYKEQPEEFIAAALSPANVVKVEIIDEELHSCRVTVPDSQLSLAIGNRGQNARLAAKLTGWKVDIRPESGFYGEDDGQDEENAQPTEDSVQPENESAGAEAEIALTEDTAEQTTQAAEDEAVVQETAAEETAEEMPSVEETAVTEEVFE
ncbi:MAG: transcription termination factor NusA [Lachnospiraceae bacterium]|nr:transcription termination factor NusA [Lachnospiraceae bacterium]